MNAPANMHEVMDQKQRQASERHLTEKDKGQEPAARGCFRATMKEGYGRRACRQEQGGEQHPAG